MLKTELKISLRGLDMFIFAICLPVAATAILGMLYSGKPAFEGAGYSLFEQSFGALSTIAVCAGGVMGLPLLVSDYRQKKILKRFKVTPVSPALLLAVHVAIYLLYSLASLALVYATAALFFDYRMAGSWLHFMGGYFLTMLSVFSIGMMVGGIAPNARRAGVIASLLFFPMLIFSGATLPYESMPPALQRAADFMPQGQGIKLLKAASLGLPFQGALVPAAVMVITATVCIAVSIRFFKWE
jgi:ABC-2 type transport system permease protein